MSVFLISVCCWKFHLKNVKGKRDLNVPQANFSSVVQEKMEALLGPLRTTRMMIGSLEEDEERECREYLVGICPLLCWRLGDSSPLFMRHVVFFGLVHTSNASKWENLYV